jgi:hypothetical protein
MMISDEYFIWNLNFFSNTLNFIKSDILFSKYFRECLKSFKSRKNLYHFLCICKNIIACVAHFMEREKLGSFIKVNEENENCNIVSCLIDALILERENYRNSSHRSLLQSRGKNYPNIFVEVFQLFIQCGIEPSYKELKLMWIKFYEETNHIDERLRFLEQLAQMNNTLEEKNESKLNLSKNTIEFIFDELICGYIEKIKLQRDDLSDGIIDCFIKFFKSRNKVAETLVIRSGVIP